MEKIRFLQCLSKQYPTIDSAATEIIKPDKTGNRRLQHDRGRR